MRLARFALLFTASAALLQGGCGDSGSDGGTATKAAAPVSAEDIEIGELLGQIRGHHRVVADRYEGGDRRSALRHAEQSTEVMTALRPDLEKHAPAAADPLTRALQAVTGAVEAGRPAAAVQSHIDDAARATREAERQAVGDTAGTEAYRGSVIASLVATAAHEYEEALAGGRFRLTEYQDGFGFAREAGAIYRLIAPAVEERSAGEAEEIEEAFTALEQAMPSSNRPASPAPPAEVERSATLIGAELEETVGARPAGDSDPKAVQAKIEELLDEVVQTYDPASPERSAELVAEAYLENYEVIEAAVIKAAPEVNAELEPLLGAALRKRIREGAPAAEIRDMVARARRLLAEGVKALEQSG